MIRRFLVFCISLSPLAAQAQLEFGSPAADYSRVLPLANGDRLLIGTTQLPGPGGDLDLCCLPGQHAQITLTGLGPALFHDQPPDIAPYPGGSANDIPNAAAVDAAGNIWIAGSTDSDDFRLVNPIVAQKVPYRAAGFVVELDPTGNHILFATYLGGKRTDTLHSATYATALAIDSAGNVYVGGYTDESDFPTTANAFLSGKGGSDIFGNTFFYSYLVKISPSGKLLFSTLVTTGTAVCGGGSSCINQQSTWANLTSLSLDASGSAVVSGIEYGVYNPSAGYGYVCRVAPDGSQLQWKADIAIPYGRVLSVFLASDPTGSLDLFGRYDFYAPATGPNVPAMPSASGLYAAQMKSDGSGLTYTVDLGQAPAPAAIGMAVDASGNVYLSGTLDRVDFVQRVDRSGTPTGQRLLLPLGAITAPPALDAGNVLLVGARGALVTLPASDYGVNTPGVVGFANAASFAWNTGLYPGALVSLFGFGLPASSEGLSVQINGIAAPILFTGPRQINIQVPFETPPFNAPLTVRIAWPSASFALQLPGGQSIGLFTTDGIHATALNQDGSPNSASNPAAPGSVVSLFGTGATWPSGMQDGAIATAALPFAAPPAVLCTGLGIPLYVLYAGAAPGLIDGVFQVNVRLAPDEHPSLSPSFGIVVNDSNVVQVYVR